MTLPGALRIRILGTPLSRTRAPSSSLSGSDIWTAYYLMATKGFFLHVLFAESRQQPKPPLLHFHFPLFPFNLFLWPCSSRGRPSSRFSISDLDVSVSSPPTIPFASAALFRMTQGRLKVPSESYLKSIEHATWIWTK
jgi:hypothetical protein